VDFAIALCRIVVFCAELYFFKVLNYDIIYWGIFEKSKTAVFLRLLQQPFDLQFIELLKTHPAGKQTK